MSFLELFGRFLVTMDIEKAAFDSLDHTLVISVLKKNWFW